MLGLPGEFVAIAAIGLPVGGFLRMLYAFLLESNAPAGVEAAQAAYAPPPAIPNYLGTPASAPTLPPQRSVPVPTPRPQRFDTGEIAPPRASVTDHTTRLLDKQPQDDSPKQ